MENTTVVEVEKKKARLALDRLNVAARAVQALESLPFPGASAARLEKAYAKYETAVLALAKTVR